MSIEKKYYKKANFCLQCGAELHFVNDHENKLRKVCASCGWTYYRNPIPASAVVILNEKQQIVIIKRKIEPNKGGWALPSGYIEIDQTPEKCAIDEMKEETNLDGKIIKELGYFSGYSPIYHNIISFGFLMEIVGGELKAGDDAAEAKFVAFNELPKICFASHRYFIEKIMKELKN